MVRSLSRALIELPRNRRGATAIEFGLLALPFFLCVFVLFQTAVIYVVSLTLSHETQRIAREIRTGQSLQAGLDMEKIRERFCSKLLNLVKCSEIALDLRSYATFKDIPKTSPIVNGALDRGSFEFDSVTPSTIMAFRVYYELPIFGITQQVMSNLSNGRYLVSSVNVFKTEPF